MTLIVEDLLVPDQAERTRLIDEERTLENHQRLMASLCCMNAVECGSFAANPAPLAFPFVAAAWNLERCLFVEESATKLRGQNSELVLLSEMDCGMARTAQRHTTRDLAAEMQMDYCYGVEFLELGLGSPVEHSFCKDDFNKDGFHGNGLMTTAPTRSVFRLTLPGRAHWFVNEIEQHRIGERMAIGAIVETVDGPFVAVSTHLESVADGPYRERQMMAIIDAVERLAPGLPILIGGDLNTGNHSDEGHLSDTLFKAAEARGFTFHGGPAEQMSTRPSLITRWPDRAMKLDWFLSRDLKISESWLETSLAEDGKPLSDHDPLFCRVEGLG